MIVLKIIFRLSLFILGLYLLVSGIGGTRLYYLLPRITDGQLLESMELILRYPVYYYFVSVVFGSVMIFLSAVWWYKEFKIR